MKKRWSGPGPVADATFSAPADYVAFGGIICPVLAEEREKSGAGQKGSGDRPPAGPVAP